MGLPKRIARIRKGIIGIGGFRHFAIFPLKDALQIEKLNNHLAFRGFNSELTR